MWFLLAVVAATFVLGILLAPKVKTENAKASGLGDFNFPRSKEGDPVGLLFGTVKLKSPNTIFAGDFEARPIKKKQKTGLFSSKKVIVGYQYFIGLALCFCLGPGVRFRRMWLGKDEIWNGCLNTCENEITIDLPDLYGGKDRNGGIGGKFRLYCGNYDQNRDTYLASKTDANVSAYRGFAYIVFEKFWWGNSAQIQPVYVEAQRFTNDLEIGDSKQIMANGLDANGIEVLFSLITNNWGCLGIDPATIDVVNWREVAVQIWDENNGISLHQASPVDVSEIAKEVMSQINATLFQNPQSGLIQIKLNRADYDIGDLPVFGPDEIEAINNLSTSLWESTSNIVRVAFVNRENSYADGLAPAMDESSIRYLGRQKSTLIKFPYLFDAVLAAELAARELSNINIPLFKADLVLNRKAVQVGPGDPFVLNWPEYGISSVVMRARKIGLGKRRDGKVTMSVVQDEFAAADAVIAIPPSSDHVQEIFQPQDIVDLMIIEVPYFLEYQATDLDTRTGYYRLATLALAPSTASIGYNAFIDDGPPDDDDPQMLELAPYNAIAALDMDLDQFDGLVDGLVAVLTIKDLSDPAALADGSEAAVRLGSGLFILNGEWLSYETYTDNLDGTYDLENVRRAMLDTGWIGGVVDDIVWFINGQEGFFSSDILPVATDLYFLDVTSNSTLAKSAATIYPITPSMRKDRPLPPDYITVDGIRADDVEIDYGIGADIEWRDRNRLLADQVAFEDDATQTAEAGTTYRIELWRDGIMRFDDDGITQPYSLVAPLGAIGFSTIKIFAIRDTLESYSAAEFPVYVNPDPDALLIDDDPVYIDDDFVEFS